METAGCNHSDYLHHYSEEEGVKPADLFSSIESSSCPVYRGTGQDQSGLVRMESLSVVSRKQDSISSSIADKETTSPLCCFLFPINTSNGNPSTPTQNRTRILSSDDEDGAASSKPEQRERMGIPRHEDYQSRQIVPENYHHQVVPTPLNPFDDQDEVNRNTVLVTSGSPQPQPPQESTYWLPYPTFFDFLDALLLFSCFRGVPVADADRSLTTNTTNKRQKVSIKVEATVVREDRDACKHSKSSQWRRQFDFETKLAESTFVEIVEDFPPAKSQHQHQHQQPLEYINTPTGIIRKGTLVTSLQKCATKARIVTMPAEELIALSQFQDLDSGEVAAIMSSYLPAFGALYHGIDLRSRENRFSSGSLSDCQVLVSGGSAVEAEAVIELALLGGASRVFVYQSKNLTKMNSPKLVMLDGPAEDYESRLYQSIDVVVDLGYLQKMEFLKHVVAPRGRLVCVVPRDQSKNILSRVKEMLGQATLIKHPGTTVYDFHDMCKSSYGEVLRDLRYLLNITQKRRLRPRVDRYIKSRDVEIMQEDMAIHPPRGTVICEPWREFIPEPQRPSSVQERLERFCAQTLRIEG
jgi:NADPH:quinone reductase-like Zn-dependent oxidoreductase